MNFYLMFHTSCERRSHQFITLLLDGLAGELNPEQREHLSTIYRSANQLRCMITDLLEATRVEGGKMTVDLRCVRSAQVIQEALAMLRATAREKGVGLEAG